MQSRESNSADLTSSFGAKPLYEHVWAFLSIARVSPMTANLGQLILRSTGDGGVADVDAAGELTTVDVVESVVLP